MKLIVGLGNPDKIYQNTRHNLGSNILKKYLATKFNATLTTKKSLAAEIFETGQGSQKIIFAIPTKYMNESGISVQKLTQFYKIDPIDTYVLHDDLDLEVGDYKIQFDRGPAGHNGVKSIIENLNTQQFNRLRIGISKDTNIPVENYVLLPFKSEELSTIESITPKIFEEIEKIIKS